MLLNDLFHIKNSNNRSHMIFLSYKVQALPKFQNNDSKRFNSD